ncbi:archaemetzincin [Solitalea sp. MAHUQ-68]|uniref:Archaemetzincin n=1 Tax=Solitalea agri TaxID=2953739 RepID=A0A9X2JCK9_9SPHI|nr:archaemetzincin [Solitalea agri]MCO4293183.1 archaemetzincin [Solitalea agri]
MRRTICLLLLTLFSCVRAVETNDEIIDQIEENDQELPVPKPGDWLYKYKEKGQTVEQYIQTNPVKPTNIRTVLYLQPIGSFSNNQKQIIDYTADYLTVFFGMKTKVLPLQSAEMIPASSRRVRENGGDQLLAPYILDSVLVPHLPEDALVVMAVTSNDLYPAPSWNYVFGLASYKKRVGVSSIYRYADKQLNKANYPQCLERLIKTSSHEIGHMFSLTHCTNAVCVMNGVNSLQESDLAPNRLCSECLQKLQWNLKFSYESRFLALRAFFKKHKLTRDYEIVSKDICLTNEDECEN